MIGWGLAWFAVTLGGVMLGGLLASGMAADPWAPRDGDKNVAAIACVVVGWGLLGLAYQMTH